MPLRLVHLLVLLALPLVGCKKPSYAPSAANEHTSAAARAAATLPTMAATMRTDNKATQADRTIAESVEKPFDFNTVPEASGNIPPFPYVAIPSAILQGSLWTNAVPMDQIWLILGNRVHAVEGRVTTRTFDNSSAQMSELEIRRNYENAMRAMGAVKVNTVAPDNPAWGPAEGDEFITRTRRLSMPQFNMTYDVYLARKGTSRNWLVVMVGSGDTRLIAIQEQPFKQTIDYVSQNDKPHAVTATGAPPLAPQPVNIGTLPLSSAVIPPFPYLPYPPGLLEVSQHTEHANFDTVQIIVGDQLRVVEGRVEMHTFANSDVNMSEMALRRNYEAAVKGLGGIKVNMVGPYDLALAASASGKPAPQHDKMRFPGDSLSYDSYVVRTLEKNIWLVLMFNDRNTSMLAVEEKAIKQSVALITADDMRKELATKGKTTVYITFDTDKADMHPYGKPAVEEIAALLKHDRRLTLAIEGHTDDSGNATHNQTLSRQRAEAVLQYLVKEGIDASRLRAVGHGATQPLADNKDETGRAKNRRVELVKI